MSFKFHLPDIGEGVVEGEIVSWKVCEGDIIKLDAPLVEVMTDKATVEIPAPRAGRIVKIHFREGEVCPVGDVLVVIDTGEEERGAAQPKNGHGQPAPPAPRRSPVLAAGARGARVLATPATRRLARALGVELATCGATGKGARVTSDDVRRVADGQSAQQVSGSAAEGAERVPRSAKTPISIEREGAEERIPFRGVRKQIAENMSRSVFTATHFTYVEEVDMTELVALRSRAKLRALERGVRLTFLPFIVKAVVEGLKKWPQLNAALDESTQEIVRKKYYHVGIAAQGPQGLSVTVLRDADKLSLFEMAAEIERLSTALQSGRATREELIGSTFTITSLGKLGGVLATPIINFPEVGILGVHKIADKPAVVDGQIVVRSLMNLSISLDHRLVDGWDGARFLGEVKTLLEDPTLMFMAMR